MVDFQSRDTRRGPTVDDEDDSDSSADTNESSEGDDGAPDTGVDPLAEGSDTAEAAADTGHPVGDDDTSAATTADSEVPPTTATPSHTVDVAVVTVSGDRAGLEDSVTGAFESAGHEVTRRERLRGGYDAIQQMVDSLVGREAVDVVVTVGGVGLSADEMAIEAVHPLLEKALPGFGEAFRSRLAEHIGTGIVGVRSTAGVSDGTLVFCLPGDVEAAQLAVEEILVPEVPKLVAALEA
jgi:molybdenum cofactor biosynthesis protein B